MALLHAYLICMLRLSASAKYYRQKKKTAALRNPIRKAVLKLK